MGRRGYPSDVRRAALEAVASGRSVYQVSRELGVSVQVIYVWRKQAEASDAGTVGTPPLRDE